MPVPKGYKPLPTRPVPYPPYDGTQPCSGLDPELFFPRTSKEVYYHEQETRPACDGCPFFDPCRDYSVSYDVQGYWAGLGLAGRRAIRRSLGIAPIPISTSDQRMIEQLLAELDDGIESAHHVAARAGVSSATVLRHRSRAAEVEEVA